jgi:hypothetical protein
MIEFVAIIASHVFLLMIFLRSVRLSMDEAEGKLDAPEHKPER